MFQNVTELSRKRKTLHFDTETAVKDEKVYINLTDFDLRRAADADGVKHLLSDSDVPSGSFDDAAGAPRAKEELKFFIDFLKDTAKARREAGHAIVCYLDGYVPAYLTIVARNDYGGNMERSPKDINNPFPAKKDLLNKICTSLGGYAEEFICCGSSGEGFPAGVSSDLESASNAVQDMITKYGMYEDFGLAVGFSDSEKLTERTNGILREQLQITKNLISENKMMFDNLVSALIKKEKIN
jgi:ATP-dependent Zn protease